MGRRNKERIARIEAGLEPSQRDKALGFMQSKTGHKVSVELTKHELSKGNTTDQIQRLGTLVASGGLERDKLKHAITSKAADEMDKGIRNLIRKGEPVTVEALCAEIKSTVGFLTLCNTVGIELEWFEQLARERMKEQGITA